MLRTGIAIPTQLISCIIGNKVPAFAATVLAEQSGVQHSTSKVHCGQLFGCSCASKRDEFPGVSIFQSAENVDSQV